MNSMCIQLLIYMYIYNMGADVHISRKEIPRLSDFSRIKRGYHIYQWAGLPRLASVWCSGRPLVATKGYKQIFGIRIYGGIFRILFIWKQHKKVCACRSEFSAFIRFLIKAVRVVSTRSWIFRKLSPWVSLQLSSVILPILISSCLLLLVAQSGMTKC